ncbi:SUMO ligase siz1 [Thoreauomyces humboldtii]|nr:SUMO ligase siz1 [Thoreauomyces humboldtii]
MGVVAKLNSGPKVGGAAKDDDIEMGNQVVTFACPITIMRIDIPGKGRKCQHAQCFDCVSPSSKWKCPVCLKVIENDGNDLEINEIWSKLLSKYPNASRCMILPNGDDAPFTEPPPKAVPSNSTSFSSSNANNKRKFADISIDVIDLDDDEGDRPSPAPPRDPGAHPMQRFVVDPTPSTVIRANSTPDTQGTPRSSTSGSQQRHNGSNGSLPSWSGMTIDLD